MNRQAHSTSREVVVASAIKEVVSELRLVDVCDYVAFIRMDHFANLSDLVEFGGRAVLHARHAEARPWRRRASRLDRRAEDRARSRAQAARRDRLFHADACRRTRRGRRQLRRVRGSAATPDENTAFLEAAIEDARIRKSEPLGLSACERRRQSIRPSRSALATACMRFTALSFCVVLVRYWLAVCDRQSELGCDLLAGQAVGGEAQAFELALGDGRLCRRGAASAASRRQTARRSGHASRRSCRCRARSRRRGRPPPRPGHARRGPERPCPHPGRAAIGPSAQPRPRRLHRRGLGSADHQNGIVETTARSAAHSPICAASAGSAPTGRDSRNRRRDQAPLVAGRGDKQQHEAAALMSTAIQRQRRTASAIVTVWCGSLAGEAAPNGLVRVRPRRRRLAARVQRALI